MANMGYCRFRNTLNDLRDCEDNFYNINSIEELTAAKRLLKLCKQIVDSVDEEAGQVNRRNFFVLHQIRQLCNTHKCQLVSIFRKFCCRKLPANLVLPPVKCHAGQ